MDWIEYPKINTIWKRESEKPCRIIVGQYSRPEFETVNRWFVTEKIDGTNVRVIWDGNKVEFRGRTDRAEMPPKLMLHLQQTFTPEKLASKFSGPVMLFGEGYGAGIQKGGGNYSKDQKFVLFDVLVDSWWLERKNVFDIANSFAIPVVPNLGTMGTQDAIYIIEHPDWSCGSFLVFPMNTLSKLAETPQTKIEGIVCRSVPGLFNRRGERCIWKLKTRDYEALKEK